MSAGESGHPADPAAGGGLIRRRTLVVGTAWATPAVLAVSSLPAVAASRPAGLQGWVSLGRTCGTGKNPVNTITIDGRGAFTGGGDNDRGLWVFIDDPKAVITDATMIFYISGTELTFTAAAGNSGWSVPVKDTTVPQMNGYVAYRTTYSGTWTWNATYRTWVAVGQPHFTGTWTGSCTQRTLYLRRLVTVNGTVTELLRGPTYL